MRTDKEDVSAQKARLEDARTEYNDALDALARAAADARKRRASPDDVRGAYARFVRAEEALDIATLDLTTASGGDA